MTSTSPWRDYARSRAVLLGAWDYTQLRPVPAARKSLDRMVGLLTGRLCGWPADHVLTLRNVAERGTVPDQLMQVFDGVTDVALFYFVGHGQLHGDELCLALRESPTNGARRLTTGLPFSDVRAALRECDARTKIVILDCCFSGTATLPDHTLAATDKDKVDVIDKASGTGAFTMAASGAYQTAWHEPDESTDIPETYFTKYLIDTIEHGVPDHPEDLSLRVIFDSTEAALVRDRRPRPTRSVRDDADRFVFTRNAALLPRTPAKRHTHRQLGLRSPSPTTTLGATPRTQVRPNATPPAREDTDRPIPAPDPARPTNAMTAEPSAPRPTDPERRTSQAGHPPQQPPRPIGPSPDHTVVYRLSPRQRAHILSISITGLVCLSLGMILMILSFGGIIYIGGPLAHNIFSLALNLFCGAMLVRILVLHLKRELILTRDGIRIRGRKSASVHWSEVRSVLAEKAGPNGRRVRFVLADKSMISPVPVDVWTMRDREFDQKVSTIQRWHAHFGSHEPGPEGGRRAPMAT
jgi:hypothetical protein